MILHKALIAFALYSTSLPTDVSFMILLVTIITSSAVLASSFIIKYTICRRDASLFWNSFEMPKKREVASFVGNLSPVKRSRAILVRSIRHRRGEIGEELNRRAKSLMSIKLRRRSRRRTFLEDRGPVDLHDRLFSVLVLFAVTHRDGVVDPSRLVPGFWDFEVSGFRVQG